MGRCSRAGSTFPDAKCRTQAAARARGPFVWWIRHSSVSPLVPGRGIRHGVCGYRARGCGHDSRHASSRNAADSASGDPWPLDGVEPAWNDPILASNPGPPPKHWSADEWDVLARLRRQRNILLADAKLGPGRASDDLARATGGLEEIPLIVLTQGNPSSPSSAGSGVLPGWMELQRRFAQRSRRGRQVLVPDSGHGMPEEAPDAIVRAVREIVTTVRDERH